MVCDVTFGVVKLHRTGARCCCPQMCREKSELKTLEIPCSFWRARPAVKVINNLKIHVSKKCYKTFPPGCVCLLDTLFKAVKAAGR